MSGVKTTFRLALACAAVFAATRLVERGEFRLSPSQNRPMRLVSRRLEEVDHVVLTDADGKVTLKVVDQEETGKWEEVEGGIQIEGDDELTFKDADGALTLDYQGVALTFEKQ